MIKTMELFLNALILSLVIMRVQSGTVQIINLTKQNNFKQIGITQMVDMEYYYFDKAQNDVSELKYVIIEVSFQALDFQNVIANTDVYPILCYDFDQDPVLNYDQASQSIDVSTCKGFDYNQYTRMTGQYSLEIELDQQSYQILQVGVFIPGVQASYSLKFRLKYSNFQDICPFDCYNFKLNQKGDCVNRECQCPIGSIDYDCASNAKLISTKNSIINLDSNMQYIYYRPEANIKNINDASDIIINFGLLNNSPPVNIFITVEGSVPKKILPTVDIYLQKFTISDDTYSLTLRPPGQFDATGSPKTTVIGLSVMSASNSVTVVITESGDDSTNTNMIIIYFLVGVVSLLFLIWIILTIIKIRYSRRNQIIDLSIAQQAQQQRLNQRRSQNVKLTLELIEQFLPQLTFEEIKKSHAQKGKQLNETCAVCLGEFENPEVCRLAICNHFFHKDCLEQWLKKQENCPFCRADLSSKSLIAHFQKQKDQSDKENDDKGQATLNRPAVDSNLHSNVNIMQPSQQQQQQQNMNLNETSAFRNQINVHNSSIINPPINANLIRSNAERGGQIPESNNVSSNLSNVLATQIINNQNDRRNFSVGNQLVIQRNMSNTNLNLQQAQAENNQGATAANQMRNNQNRNSVQVQELDLIN